MKIVHVVEFRIYKSLSGFVAHVDDVDHLECKTLQQQDIDKITYMFNGINKHTKRV